MSRDRDIEASKAFLDAERGGGGGGGGGGPSSSSRLGDLIKCFCGVCESLFKRKSIEYALKANGEELLRDPESREILKKFLLFRQGKSHFQSPAQKIVELFELCEAVVSETKQLDDYRDDITDLCYTEAWETRFSNAITNGTTNDMLHDLMRESAIRLENDLQYAAFKEELKKKLKL